MSKFHPRRTALRAVSVLASAAALLVIALLMGSHTPFRTQAATSAPAERGRGHWQAVYILGSECPCSTRVAKHLAPRERLDGIEERMILVGDDDETAGLLGANGWKVERWAAERARDVYGALSAPLLVFVDPDGAIRYSGGFARRSDFRDGFQEPAVWASLRAGREVTPFPAYGCALQFGCALGGLSQSAEQLKSK